MYQPKLGKQAVRLHSLRVFSAAPQYPPASAARFIMEPSTKKQKTERHRVDANFEVTGLHITDHVFKLPLDYTGAPVLRLPGLGVTWMHALTASAAH